MRVIGVDTGGTFTDFIYKEGDKWGIHKRLSTPHNPSEAVIAGIRHIENTEVESGSEPNQMLNIVHGSTVATNAILERKGVKTALITNDGFTDVIEIGRQNRFELYNFAYQRQEHIVPEALRFGVGGRIDHEGKEVAPFDTVKAEAAVEAIAKSGAESIAVCFLFPIWKTATKSKCWIC